MPATIALNYLGNSEDETDLLRRLQEFMEPHPGDWTITILGAQHNTIWEMTVTSPDGQRQWVHKLYGEDGGHTTGKILAELNRITNGQD